MPLCPFHLPPPPSLRFFDFDNQTLTTLIGKLGRGHADGDIEKAALNRPRAVVELKDGSLVVVDAGNSALRLIDPQWRTVSTLKLPRFTDAWGLVAVYSKARGQVLYVSDRAQAVIMMVFAVKPQVRKRETSLLWSGRCKHTLIAPPHPITSLGLPAASHQRFAHAHRCGTHEHP